MENKIKETVVGFKELVENIEYYKQFNKSAIIVRDEKGVMRLKAFTPSDNLIKLKGGTRKW